MEIAEKSKKSSTGISEQVSSKKISVCDGSDSDNGNQPEVVHDFSDLSSSNFRPSHYKIKRATKAIEPDSNLKKGGYGRSRYDPFPGEAPISQDKIKRYKRGHKVDTTDVKTHFHQKKLKSTEKKFSHAVKQAARTELLLTEEAGFIEAEEGEHTCDYNQHEISRAVDVSSAQKFFELKLDKFGPYKLNYTKNGRFLLLGGGRGHVATFDWQTKKLMCEINTMETCNDVKWLHQETMFAVAQKQWTYMYDNQGIELHCLKMLDQVLSMEFLPFHFLLATANAKSYLSWIDVSIGQKVAGFGTGLGRLDVMCQNPSNAIIHLGHSGGTVTMWSPNVKEPLVKMLCHGSGTRAITVNHTGQYMATSGIDRKLKLWDLRMLRELRSYKIGTGAGQLVFSQRGLLAAGLGQVVEVYEDCVRNVVQEPYLSHQSTGPIRSLQFCPFEDVLGVGHAAGFSSLLIPGAGEPNFDALEANPYQSKKQRQQAEVKMLMDKIQPDMISMDTHALGQMDMKTMQQKLEEKVDLKYLKPKKVEFAPKYKKKGRSKAGKLELRKQGVIDERKRQKKREFVARKREDATSSDEETETTSMPTADVTYSALDRFKKKKS